VSVDPFTYVTPVSSVTGVAPATGTTAGGITVVITGTGFTGATTVAFGAAPAASFTVVSDTEITAVSPAQAVGTRNIVVTSAVGTSTPVGASDLFTYTVPISVTGVAPATGTTAGGTTVVITGTGFTGATTVVFGAAPAASFTVVSDTEITAVSPAQAVGTRNIVVTSAVGTSTPVGASDQFTYKA
jgi:large repetitive protein